MTLRIIGGTFRNRLLKAPKGSKTRPTLAVLRKAVFDILQPIILEAHFLDLFAGSGMMGIEALSRGASHVTFVDIHSAAIQCIKENLQLLGLQKQATVFQTDAQLALQKCAKKKLQFSAIYIDPPYSLSQTTPLLSDLLLFIDTNALLAEHGILLIEETTPPLLPILSLGLMQLRYINTRKFSDSILHQYVG